jgi:hypothetical protein
VNDRPLSGPAQVTTPRARPAPGDPVPQGLLDEVGAHVLGRGPAHDPAGGKPSACSAMISAFPAPRRADPPPLHLVTDTVTGLLARFAHIREHRHLAWVDHPLPAVLALCVGAVVAGMGSFTAIAGWIADASEEILTCAYAGSGLSVPTTGPSRITIWRVLTGLDPAALDTAIGDWLLDQAYAELASRAGSSGSWPRRRPVSIPASATPPCSASGRRRPSLLCGWGHD